MTALVFLDTETTGLSLDDDIWEFAAIRRESDGTEKTNHLFIEHDRNKCAQLPASFRDDHYARFRDHEQCTTAQAAARIADIFRDGRPHIVGAVPNFDTERLHRLLSRWNAAYKPGWHYHLIDVETLAVGYLAGIGKVVAPPWDSDELTAAIGLDPVPEDERHTALGDARWAMRIYDKVTGGTP